MNTLKPLRDDLWQTSTATHLRAQRLTHQRTLLRYSGRCCPWPPPAAGFIPRAIIQPRLLGFIEPHQPSKVARPPSGPLWVHKIKQDGYRLIVRWDGARIQRQIAQVVAVMLDQVEREQHHLMNPGAWCAAHGSQASRPRG